MFTVSGLPEQYATCTIAVQAIGASSVLSGLVATVSVDYQVNPLDYVDSLATVSTASGPGGGDIPLGSPRFLNRACIVEADLRFERGSFDHARVPDRPR